MSLALSSVQVRKAVAFLGGNQHPCRVIMVAPVASGQCYQIRRSWHSMHCAVLGRQDGTLELHHCQSRGPDSTSCHHLAMRHR